uniref:NADH dehydrogenase subunit 2 n=1 Tax=Dexia fulvifera TaxID=569034 RepID=UPI0022FD9708|nr:NADH dehydrogenase subunit 2 [Dexia fulvifera]WAS35303.1 NADH dehydrogenase subunit 2 [Dexia fulvifera]
MFNNSSKIIFMMMMMMSTIISISANSWMTAWMGLEINLLAFIPLMSANKLMSTESSLKYFLIQAFASSVMLFAVIIYMMNLKIHFMNITEMMIFSSLLLKMGAAPFHFWFPSVLEGLTWLNSLMLMTWQKVAPMMLISYIIIKPLMIISIIMSSLIGALGGLNQTSLRKIMAYSSINHLSWMLMALYNNNLLWVNYFLMYSFLSMLMIFMFNLFMISHINQLFMLKFNSKILFFFMMCNLLSLGGLPPFLGFFPKWIIIQSLTLNNQLFLLMIMILSALITLYFYIRLSYNALMLNYYENNWMINSFFNKKLFNLLIFASFLSMTGFFTISSLYYIF